MLEFDGNKVESNDMPNSLEFEGDEIFDVKKSSKATLQQMS